MARQWVEITGARWRGKTGWVLPKAPCAQLKADHVYVVIPGVAFPGDMVRKAKSHLRYLTETEIIAAELKYSVTAVHDAGMTIIHQKAALADLDRRKAGKIRVVALKRETKLAAYYRDVTETDEEPDETSGVDGLAP